MFTPMLVQYLVGLCCLHNNPNAVDITLGDMVLDTASETKRDIDITVTIEEASKLISVFKAYEVKKEKEPLDVAKVGELCNKFGDMPSITHRAIVSASGFTSSAKRKAEKHKIELFSLEEWTTPLEVEFPDLGLIGQPSQSIPTNYILLCWINCYLYFHTPTGTPAFEMGWKDSIFTSTGLQHPKYLNYKQLSDKLLLRSTNILIKSDRIIEKIPVILGTITDLNSPPWSDSHTMDIYDDDINIKLNGELVKLEAVTIRGELKWEMAKKSPIYYVMRRVTDGKPFAGAIIALGKEEGQMNTLILSPNSKSIGVHFVQLEEKHLNAIRKLKLKNTN